MTDPKRLVDETRDPAVARALHAGIRFEPPPGVEGAVWTALGAAIAAGAGTSIAASSGAAKGLGAFAKGLFAGKWWLSMLAAAIVGASGYLALRDEPRVALPTGARLDVPAATAVPTSRARSPAVATSAEIPTVALEDLEALPTSGAPRPASSPRPAPSGDVPPLDDGAAAVAPSEGELVVAARKALRAGDASSALELIGRARAAFPGGSLAQERDALEIDALMKSGASTAARARARDFLRRYPKSPYAKNVEAILR